MIEELLTEIFADIYSKIEITEVGSPEDLCDAITRLDTADWVSNIIGAGLTEECEDILLIAAQSLE